MFQAKDEPAVAEAERAIALDPNDERSYVALANVFNFSGERTTEAIELLEKAIRLNPRYSFDLPFNLGWAYIFLGRLEEANGLAEKALRRPRLLPVNLIQLGHTYYLIGRTEQAIAALKKSLNSSPADLDAHLHLAAVYSELGQDAEAQAEAAEVLRINPNWSLEVWKQRVPYKDPAMLERGFAVLRKAGLK